MGSVDGEWYDFENEIKSKNRFFPKAPLINEIKKVIQKSESILSHGSLFFRARVYKPEATDGGINNHIKRFTKSLDYNELTREQTIEQCKSGSESDYKKCLSTDIWGYDANGSGMPPLEKTNIGRANPKFLPYFYLAEDDYTAIAEIRPYPGDEISVAKYTLRKSKKVIDFIGDDGGCNKYSFPQREDEIFQRLYCLFSLPTRNPDFDYIVPQYITELIKEMGFAGMRFASSLSPMGANITVFNQDDFEFISSHVYYVKRIIVDAMRHFPHYSNNIEAMDSDKWVEKILKVE